MESILGKKNPFGIRCPHRNEGGNLHTQRSEKENKTRVEPRRRKKFVFLVNCIIFMCFTERPNKAL